MSPPSLQRIPRVLFLALCLNMGLSQGAEEVEAPLSPRPTPNFFNGTDVIMRLNGPLRVNVYEAKGPAKVLIERIDVVTPVVAEVSTALTPGENETLISSMTVNYTGIDCKGLINNNSLLSGVSFSLEFTFEKSRWILTSISASLSGSVVNGTSPLPLPSGDLPLRPYIKSGYSPSPADRAFGRDYLTGSPSKTLSWYCDRQEFSEDPSSKSPGALILALEFPGLLVQPFNTTALNGTLPKFGFSWDCDPLISAKLLEVLFIVFILIAIFLWSVQMMMNLNTPSRFDDPKGKPLSVPHHD